MSGKLILVVGPSGVGKDTLLDTAKEYLAEEDRFIFPRRYITRSAQAGGENHHALSAANYSRMKADGRFVLSWDAHGLQYGVPVSTIRDIANGNTVIVNVSRSVIEDAQKIYPDVVVACITAHAETLRSRLLARGRETAQDIEKRIKRASAYSLSGPHIHPIDNSGTLSVAVKSFVTLISNPTYTNRHFYDKI